MAENYKHLYEQTKKMLTMYQDELIPGFRKQIEELELTSKWIPVTERLPEQGGWYMVYTKNKGDIARRTNKAQYYHQSWHGNGGRWDNVTHWMPLPDLPKEVE